MDAQALMRGWRGRMIDAASPRRRREKIRKPACSASMKLSFGERLADRAGFHDERSIRLASLTSNDATERRLPPQRRQRQNAGDMIEGACYGFEAPRVLDHAIRRRSTLPTPTVGRLRKTGARREIAFGVRIGFEKLLSERNDANNPRHYSRGVPST